MKKIILQIIFCMVFAMLSVLCFGCSVSTKKVDNNTVVINTKKYIVSNESEFEALQLSAGDTVVLKNGAWKNAQLHFKGKGTEQMRIVLMAETPGKVLLTGNANLKIDGEWLTVEGLLFSNGFSLKDDVILFTKSSAHCCLLQSAIINYNPPAKETDYKWVSMYGFKNRVANCEFTGKSHQGTTLVVWLSEQPNYHEIENNYFGPRPALGNNGGETIRIGTSDWSMYDSYTKVWNNIFDNCDGEMEIISVKSCHNSVSNNLFYECDGTLTLRHGNNNLIEENYFIGNEKPNTGGIRVIGEGHVIKNNYLYLLSGKSLHAAVSVMNALEKPKLNEYWQVKNTVIEGNVIVQCEQAFVVGAGKNTTRVLPPDSLAIIGNYVLLPGKLLVQEDNPTNFIVNSNQVRGAALVPGFINMPADMLKKDKNGIWQLKDNNRNPFWKNDFPGPDWMKNKSEIFTRFSKFQ